MQLVIDVPESVLWSLKNEPIKANFNIYELAAYIDKGIQLPKGHGRLIDADAFISKMEDISKRQKYNELLINDCLTVDDVLKAIAESLQNVSLAEGDAPTIIEADIE